MQFGFNYNASFHIIGTYTDVLLICTVRHACAVIVPYTCSGSWKTMQFKPYNFNSLGMPLQAGHLHPLMKVREEMRQIFLEMGLAHLSFYSVFSSAAAIYKIIWITLQQQSCSCVFTADLRKCQPTTLSKALSGTLMLSFNHNITQHVTPMILSSCKVYENKTAKN